MEEGRSWKLEGEEDEEEEVDETNYKQYKDAVLFVIDVSKSMLTPAPPQPGSKKADTDSPLSAALKCAYTLMQQRIISNPNDMMGILLYGTAQSKFQTEESSRGALAYPNCYLLTDLGIPSAEDVKAIKNLVEDEVEFGKLMVPSAEPVSMSNILFCSNQIFATRTATFTSRRLFLVTDNDDPNENKGLRNAAAVRARDLYDLGVFIELFPIAKPGAVFEKSKFYNDIIYFATPTDPQATASLVEPTKVSSSADGITLLNSLLSSVNSKAVPKRALFSNLPFEIGPGFKISVKGYILFKHQEIHRTSYIWLGGEKPQIAKLSRSQMADDTGREIDKREVRKAYKFGGEQIAFSPDEIGSLRNFGDPVIRLIGFKPITQQTLPLWANVGRATFMYPSEDDYVGSTRVFSALQQKLTKSKKMGIAWYIARKNAAPVISAIVPGAEMLNDDGHQELPPGLWLIPLPYADDVRDNPASEVVPASDSLIDKMRIVIQQLQLPKAQYDPSRYPNPALQWHYRILQALALEEDLPEKAEDKTEPRYKQIHKRAGSYMLEWGSQLDADNRTWQDKKPNAVSLPKRPASGEAAEKLLKKIKVETVAKSDDEMRNIWQTGGIAKLTMTDLKVWMGTKALDTSGKKADLVDRVEIWLDTH